MRSAALRRLHRAKALPMPERSAGPTPRLAALAAALAALLAALFASLFAVRVAQLQRRRREQPLLGQHLQLG